MKKQNTRREFIKRGAQIAGAGLLTTGLLGCNALLDETDGGGLSLRIGHTTLYWTNSSSFTINKSSINGAGSQTILDRTGSVTTVTGIAVCPSINKIYWTEADNGASRTSLRRSNLDGSGVENLITITMLSTGDFFTGVAVDVPSGKVYWAETTSSSGTTPGIHRADLDGSNPSFQITGTRSVSDVALDTKAGKMYYVRTGTNEIRQANLDGSGDGQVLNIGSNSPIAIALDTDNGKMYWTQSLTGIELLRRANLDTSSQETLVSLGSGTTIGGLTLDTQAEKVYWVQTTSGTSTIRRANMDSTGTGKETLLTGTGFNRLDLG